LIGFRDSFAEGELYDTFGRISNLKVVIKLSKKLKKYTKSVGKQPAQSALKET